MIIATVSWILIGLGSTIIAFLSSAKTENGESSWYFLLALACLAVAFVAFYQASNITADFRSKRLDQ